LKLLIDATNISIGGGLVHLQNILHSSNLSHIPFEKIIVFGGRTILDNFDQHSLLDLREIPKISDSILNRILWQIKELPKFIEKEKGLLFFPGGSYFGNCKPYVTMFQNMQIFETLEKNREGFSKEWIRLHFLQKVQKKTFKHSSGLICLSSYAWSHLQFFYPKLLKNKEVRIIPHGVSKIKNKKKYQFNEKIKLLYVSTVKKYKHQWHLIDAVALLIKKGFPLELHLIGSGDGPAIQRMRKSIQDKSFLGAFAYYHGHLSHSETQDWYHQADLFAFASSCETFGISLLEAMAAGLPIACSDRGPLPEVLKDAGVYFNPENPSSIAESLKLLIQDKSLRENLGKKAHSLSQAFSWEHSSHETFTFLSSVYKNHFYE